MNDALAIWWLSQHDCEAIGDWPAVADLPPYLVRQYESRRGRPGRGRLRQLGIHFDQIDGIVNSDQLFVKDPSGFTWEFQEPK